MAVPGQGPLAGLKVVEFVGIGPGPHCSMMLADMGADVLRIDREGGNGSPNPVNDRGRACMTLDIRSPQGAACSLELLEAADVLIEGFRPGVMERLGLGPDVVCQRNPQLVYGRMTGWGQQGPLAGMAGHDINYIAVAGALGMIGRPGELPTIPLNLIGDFGAGSMLLAFGILAALWERERSGKGQVIDAAIIDGVTSQLSFFAGLRASGRLSLERERNLLSGAAPFYRCYACRDGLAVAVGAIEPAFFACLVERLDLPDMADSQDPARWGELEAALTDRFAERDRAEWLELFAGTDGCVSAVLSLDEAMAHPHMRARQGYVDVAGMAQAAPAPRFSRTPGLARADVGESGAAMAARWKAAIA